MHLRSEIVLLKYKGEIAPSFGSFRSFGTLRGQGKACYAHIRSTTLSLALLLCSAALPNLEYNHPTEIVEEYTAGVQKSRIAAEQ